jgi:hypothetical protein
MSSWRPRPSLAGQGRSQILEVGNDNVSLSSAPAAGLGHPSAASYGQAPARLSVQRSQPESVAWLLASCSTWH